MGNVTDIAQLIAAVGAARAQGAANSGQIWGGALRGLGDLSADAYKQSQLAKVQQQEAALRAQQMDASRSQMTLAQNQDTREQGAFDAQRATQAQALRDATHQRMVQAMGAVRSAPDAQKPAIWGQVRAGIIGQGWAKPEDVPASYPGDAAVDSELRGLMSAKEQWDVAHPKLEMIPAGGSALDPNTRQVVATGEPRPAPNKPIEQQLLEAEQAGNKPLAAQIRSVMNARDVNMAPPDQSAVTLTPEGLDAAAMMFAKTGQLPPMGMGKQAAEARTKIINRAAAMTPGLDLASAKADFGANQDSLKAIQKQRDAVGSFESTALKNLDQFMGTAQKVIDSGSPLLNRPIRSFSDAVLGSPDMAAFNVARRTVVPEFAKILSNPSLSGQLSDSARKEVEDVVSGNATLPQIMAVAKILKTDAANRRTSMDNQIATIKGRISKATTPDTTKQDEGSTSGATGAPTYADYLKSRGGK